MTHMADGAYTLFWLNVIRPDLESIENAANVCEAWPAVRSQPPSGDMLKFLGVIALAFST